MRQLETEDVLTGKAVFDGNKQMSLLSTLVTEFVASIKSKRKKKTNSLAQVLTWLNCCKCFLFDEGRCPSDNLNKSGN